MLAETAVMGAFLRSRQEKGHDEHLSQDRNERKHMQSVSCPTSRSSVPPLPALSQLELLCVSVCHWVSAADVPHAPPAASCSWQLPEQ
jgi:hypothetical protein